MGTSWTVPPAFTNSRPADATKVRSPTSAMEPTRAASEGSRKRPCSASGVPPKLSRFLTTSLVFTEKYMRQSFTVQ